MHDVPFVYVLNKRKLELNFDEKDNNLLLYVCKFWKDMQSTVVLNIVYSNGIVLHVIYQG